MSDRLKGFEQFIVESQYDHEDYNHYRDVDWMEDATKFKQHAKFSVIWNDGKDIAILKGPRDVIYALYLDNDRIQQYRLYHYEILPSRVDVPMNRRNEDDYSTEYEDYDDLAAIGFASDYPDSKIGYGMSDWQEGKDLVVMDRDVLKDIDDNFGIDKKVQQEIQQAMDKNPIQSKIKGTIKGREFGF